MTRGIFAPAVAVLSLAAAPAAAQGGDEDGACVLCGVTTQGEVKVRAETPSSRGETATRASNGGPARADVELREGTG
jgi:hypothetical protein